MDLLEFSYIHVLARRDVLIELKAMQVGGLFRVKYVEKYYLQRNW